jgi:CheY-like chemotaxis protein
MTVPPRSFGRAVRHTALLAEHDFDARRIHADYLKQFAFEVEEAADGRDALVKALTRTYDVIVAGTHLPFIDGCALCSLLRHDAKTRTVPILVVTDGLVGVNRDRALRAGADTVLATPCLPEALLAEISRVLEPRVRARGGEVARASVRQGSVRSGDACVPSLRPASHLPLSHAHRRGDTTAPPLAAPILVCPECDKPLEYRGSHVGGVSARHPEQWDDYECSGGCGMFQYRQRTRRLRKLS